MKFDKNQYKSYKLEVVEFIDKQVLLGRKLPSVLANINVAKSSYYSWKQKLKKQESGENNKKVHPLKISPAEEQLVLDTKHQHMDKRHRQIQGIIQQAGYYISASSVFKILKANQLVQEFERREAPWKKPRYEIPKHNLVWGTDWTKIKINFETWHLLTLIDFFSRKIIQWQIVPEVNSSNIKAIYQAGLISEKITEAKRKPRLRADLGAPNTARATREFIAALSGDMPSFARVRRPTDNAITERFYGTIKQEEIYIVGSYPDLHSANEEIARYMNYYNDNRPHQSLWNFTPSYVHQINNKSQILAELEDMKFNTRSRRREYWALKETIEFQQKIIDKYQSNNFGVNYTLNNLISSTIEKA